MAIKDLTWLYYLTVYRDDVAGFHFTILQQFEF